MAMIPPDVGVRLRLPGDTGLAPTTQVAEIPADLPDFQPGQMFSARIQEVLPENTYRALVAGRQMTLSLPEGAKAGDTLELVVIDRTQRLIVARQASNTPAQLPLTGADPHTTLSPTAQMISRLLAEQPATQPAALNRGTPLLPNPPQVPAQSTQLATALAQGVSNSGLFYEAHQAQWIAGKRPLGSLLQEPQAAFSPAHATLARQTAEAAASPPAMSPRPTAQAAAAEGEQQLRPAETPTAQQTTATSMPEELRPLVHQQLEAAASQRLVWHGELWPGQHMQWEIQEEPHPSPGEEQDEAAWQTTLRLSTPRLGSIEAQLRLSGKTLQLTLNTPYGASAADMRDELPNLAAALDASGITLGRALVRHIQDEEQAS